MARWQSTGQCWLCLRFPALVLDYWLRESPDACLALHRQDQLVSVSPAAEAVGVQVGMGFTSALALCPDLQLRCHEPALQSQLHTQLAHWAYSFTPHIHTEPELLLLELSASLRLFHGLDQLMAQITAALDARKLRWRAGLAPTAAAARLLAQADLPLMQQLARWQQPGELIESLPLALLDSPERCRQRLARAGFQRIAQVLDQPRAALGKRFGEGLVLALNQLTGAQPMPVPTLPMPQAFEVSRVFMYGLSDVAHLQPVMQQLLDEFRQYLLRHQQVCQQLCWRFVAEDKSVQTLLVTVQQAHADTGEFAGLSQLRMEQLTLTAAVEIVSLQAPLLQAAHNRTGSLFRELQDNNEDLARLADRLYQRFDEHQLYCLGRLAEPVPEYSQQYQRVQALSQARIARLRPAPAQGPMDPLHCPWLFPAPEPAALRGDSLYWRGQPLEPVTEHRRIDSRWWTRERVRRDYCIARQASRFYQCFFCHRQQRWFVSGCYVC